MCITVTMLSGCKPRNTLPEPYAEHKIVSASSLTEVWTQITYSMQKDYMSPLGAASGKVCCLVHNQVTLLELVIQGSTGCLNTVQTPSDNSLAESCLSGSSTFRLA